MQRDRGHLTAVLTLAGQGLLQMKATMNIDCTPEEARAFLGLPDVQPIKEQQMKEIQERMYANLKAMDQNTLINAWLPTTFKGFEQLQELFASQMSPNRKK